MIHLIVILIVLGLLMWVVNEYLPIPQPFKNLIMVVAVLAAILYILREFGVM